MVYVFYGPDDFTFQEELARLKAGLDPDGMLSTNTSLLEGQEVTLSQLTALCDTLPFLGSHRLIIVRGLLGRLEGQRSFRRGQRGRSPAEGDALAGWGALADYVAQMPLSAVLVLVDGALSSTNPLLRALAPHAQVREFRLPGLRDVPIWIQRRAEATGVAIAPTAVALLANLVGSNLWTLASELDKLALYAAGRRIEAEDVQALVASAREANIFVLVDAVVEGRATLATRLLHQLMAEGTAPAHVLAMLARQYRHLLLARELRRQGLSGLALGQRLGISSEFALQKVLDQAQRFSEQRLRLAHARLLEADASIKRGIYDEGVALDLLVNDLARETAVRPGRALQSSGW